MDTSLLITLQEYGLSEKEAKVYLTILELGTNIASTIARRSEIKRVTVYTILDDLKKKGIVNEITKDDIKYYSVISPDILLRQLEQKYESFKEKVPELLSLTEKFGNRPKMQFFEGGEGLKKMYNELLGSKETIRSFLGTHQVNQNLKNYLNRSFVPLRVSRKIKAKVILCQSPDNKEYHQENKKNLIESLFIDHDIFHLPCAIDIHGSDKISFVMFSDEEMSGLIVTSSKLHDTLASIFDFIWETNKIHDKRKR